MEVFAARANYDSFDTDNDPHGERDFQELTLVGAGLFWKMDYYDPTLTFGLSDPADPAMTLRVHTAMLAESGTDPGVA